MKAKILIALILICGMLISYTYGYDNGQSSVYLKVKNDKELMRMEYGK